ncbi:universal stress protein [Solirubrobacter phytolaccae]|uniref:Universal stress protein n=1 Tax=Solirubrobacter phytolaccae TaxID=1404360 RepID=A0A9X3NC34_9ACTN|nr:universal stress protein [Solirubrobacter phytolaccae]MDA0183698.1 universal stress protein [Solirubrobacter phytolaccae]
MLAIAFDGSPSAALAVRAAASFFPNATATLITVPAPPPPGATSASRWLMNVPSGTLEHALAEINAEATEEASELAAEGAAQAGASGLTATPLVTKPHAPSWEALLNAAKTAGAQALVCGARGRGEIARAVLGSTSISLLHHADLPLLIVPDDAVPSDGPVLIAYDGSPAADHAIDVAGALLPGRTATVVHVWASQYRRSRAVSAIARGEISDVVSVLDQALADEAAAITAQGAERASATGLDAIGETVESRSGVWRTVRTLAADKRASLVVTGARGIGGARSALLGSVSSGLVHNADTPVLVVHAEAP